MWRITESIGLSRSFVAAENYNNEWLHIQEIETGERKNVQVSKLGEYDVLGYARRAKGVVLYTPNDTELVCSDCILKITQDAQVEAYDEVVLHGRDVSRKLSGNDTLVVKSATSRWDCVDTRSGGIFVCDGDVVINGVEVLWLVNTLSDNALSNYDKLYMKGSKSSVLFDLDKVKVKRYLAKMLMFRRFD